MTDYNLLLNQFMNKLTSDGLERASAISIDGRGGRGKVSFMEAIAIAMAMVQAQQLGKMMNAFEKMEQANIVLGKTGKLDTGVAQSKANDFALASSQFQTYSQLFSMTSNATSTALKAIGEGTSSVLRKS